jgi:uncharacterized protein
MNVPISSLNLLLCSMDPVLVSGTYAFVSAPHEAALASVQVIASTREPEGLSAIVDEADAIALNLKILFRAAWITLTVTSDLQSIGFTAAVSAAMAQAGISCNVVAGAWHDHLFVPVERAEEAMAVLVELQAFARTHVIT